MLEKLNELSLLWKFVIGIVTGASTLGTSAYGAWSFIDSYLVTRSAFAGELQPLQRQVDSLSEHVLRNSQIRYMREIRQLHEKPNRSRHEQRYLENLEDELKSVSDQLDDIKERRRRQH